MATDAMKNSSNSTTSSILRPEINCDQI